MNCLDHYISTVFQHFTLRTIISPPYDKQLLVYTFHLCSLTHSSHSSLSLSLITFFLAWYHFLCWPVLPVDPGGWQSHPVQPARLLETEQPSSPHWTHRQTRHHETMQAWRRTGTGTHAHARTHTQRHKTHTQWQKRSNTPSTHSFHVQKKRVGERW